MTDAFIQTERLVLSPITMDDLDDEASMMGDPRVMEFITGGVPRTRERVRQSIERSEHFWRTRGHGMFCVRTLAGVFVGDGLLVPLRHSGVPEAQRADPEGYGPDVEVGYRLKHEHWGKGYATEIARALIVFGVLSPHGPELRRVVAVTEPDHAASVRVLLKAGLSQEGETDAYYDRTLRLFAFERPAEAGPTRVVRRFKTRVLALQVSFLIVALLYGGYTAPMSGTLNAWGLLGSGAAWFVALQIIAMPLTWFAMGMLRGDASKGEPERRALAARVPMYAALALAPIGLVVTLGLRIHERYGGFAAKLALPVLILVFLFPTMLAASPWGIYAFALCCIVASARLLLALRTDGGQQDD